MTARPLNASHIDPGKRAGQTPASEGRCRGLPSRQWQDSGVLFAGFLACAAALASVFLGPATAWSQQQSPSRSYAVLPGKTGKGRSALFLARRGLGRQGEPTPAGILIQARASHAALVRARAAAAQMQTPAPVWQPIGPGQVSTSSWNLVTGRVTSIAADPSVSSGNTVYVGTTGGGVWRSTNAADATLADVSFVPLTDNVSAFSSAALTSLSIGAVSVQPGGTGVILAGTGDPNDATDSWYGAGILRSADGGNTWSLISTTSGSGSTYTFLGNAFAGFAWSSVTPSLVVAAVSQSEYGSILGGSASQAIPGVYYSADAGLSWQLATIEDDTTVIQSPQMSVALGNAATAVVWNPIRQRFYAAIRLHGYYESADGITWTRLASQPGANLSTFNCPSDPGQPGAISCPMFRGALAVQPLTGDMFALTVDQNNLDQGLYQDVCSRTSGACASGSVQFGMQIADRPLDSIGGDGTIPQGGYNLWLAAVPSQQDTLLFAGATDIWRCSLASSCAWRNTTNAQTCAAAHVAPAQHAVDATFGASGLLYFGNDGGLWRSTDAVSQQDSVCSPDDAAHFDNLNGALGSLAEVESFSEDPTDSSVWLAAMGGLGTAAAPQSGTVWNQVLDGEGNMVAVDPADAQNWYATSEFGVGVNRCIEGTACDTAAFGNVVIGESQVEDDVQLIPAPWILDPQDTANLILGTCRVWRGPATGAGWGPSSLLSTMLDSDQGTFCNGNAEIRSLAAAMNTSGGSPGSEHLYAGMAGTLDGGATVPGHVFTASVNVASQASNTTWIDLAGSPIANQARPGEQFDPGGFDISDIYADPHDATGRTIYVTVQGYTGSSVAEPLVYRSTDAGAHWYDITANLPNAPVNAVAVDPNDANIIYVASDTGVYMTQNVAGCSPAGAICWNVFGSGLPNAPAMALMTWNEGSVQVLRVATYGRGIWQTTLATAGIAPTTANLSPGSLTFAAQQVQTVSARQTLAVTNSGALNLNINSVTITGDFSETDNCSGESLAPAASCQILVTFDPTKTGARQGGLTLFANVPGGQLTAALSGTGLAPAAVLLNPGSLSFDPTTIGSPSAAQSISISNTGGDPVALNGESVTGDFSIAANTCGSTLAPQSGCTVSIVFKPAASGLRSGVLTVRDALGSQVAQLSGTGQTAATDALSPLSLAFAAQQIGTTSPSQQVTLTNSGDQALTGITLSVTGDFTVVNNCGSLLQGHGTCTIPVSYVPARVGAVTGTLTVTDEFRSQTATLAGTGLAPPGISATPVSIGFGGYAVGSASGVQTVTVTNSGGYSLTALSATISPGFTIAGNNCPATLPIQSACQIDVTFSPSAAGPATGMLAISAANLTRSLVVALSGSGEDFSLVVTGSSSTVITSGQSANFSLQLTGLAGTTGTVALDCGPLPQNATCSVNPASLTLTGSNTSTVSVSIMTGVAAASALRRDRWSTTRAALLALVVPVCFAFRRRRAFAATLFFLLLVFLPAGCGVGASSGSAGSGSGSSGGSQNSTPPSTYAITVRGTMSNITHSVVFKLTVQ